MIKTTVLTETLFQNIYMIPFHLEDINTLEAKLNTKKSENNFRISISFAYLSYNTDGLLSQVSQ